jgi:photosystem II stability/assembly factor-like uncharacterized protein
MNRTIPITGGRRLLLTFFCACLSLSVPIGKAGAVEQSKGGSDLQSDLRVMRAAQAASHVLDVATLSTPTKNMVWLVVHLSRPDNTRIKSFVLHSCDGGQSWREQLVETEHRLLGICFVNAEIGWVSGSGGMILHTTDGGGTWVRQKSGTASSLVQIRFRDITTGWAMSDVGEMLVTTDGGFDWGVHEIKVDQWVNYFDFSDSLHGWVVGEKNSGLSNNGWRDHVEISWRRDWLHRLAKAFVARRTPSRKESC